MMPSRRKTALVKYSCAIHEAIFVKYNKVNRYEDD